MKLTNLFESYEDKLRHNLRMAKAHDDTDAIEKYLRLLRRLRTSEFSGGKIDRQAEKLKTVSDRWRHAPQSDTPNLLQVTIEWHPTAQDDWEHGLGRDEVIRRVGRLLAARGFNTGAFYLDHDVDHGLIVGEIEADDALVQELSYSRYFIFRDDDDTIRISAEWP